MKLRDKESFHSSAEWEAYLLGLKEGALKESEKWRTARIGLPIIRELLKAENVEIPSPHVLLIPDEALWEARAEEVRAEAAPLVEKLRKGNEWLQRLNS